MAGTCECGCGTPVARRFVRGHNPSRRLPWEQSYTIDPSTGCHIWQRGRQSRGYGMFWFQGRTRLAHHVAWVMANGEEPATGKVIDHICEVKACVNPAHLRELENWQNIRRRYPASDDQDVERRMAVNRRSQQKRRGNYSATYTAERGESDHLVSSG